MDESHALFYIFILGFLLCTFVPKQKYQKFSTQQEGMAHSGTTKYQFANFDSNNWNIILLRYCQNLGSQLSKSLYRPHSADLPSFAVAANLPSFGGGTNISKNPLHHLQVARDSL